MKKDLAATQPFEDAELVIRELLGGGWVDASLRDLAGRQRPTKGGIERLLRPATAHPLVHSLSKAASWRFALANQQGLSDGDAYRFLWIAQVLKEIKTLDGGDGLARKLVATVKQRQSPKTIREFWDTFFEAEVAYSWASAGHPTGFAAPNQNPDVYIIRRRSVGNPVRFPIECWRASRATEYTAEYEDLWTQLQAKLHKWMRKAGQLVKVSIRGHRSPLSSDLSPLFNAIVSLTNSLTESGTKQSWVTDTALEESYQVSVGWLGHKGLRIQRPDIDYESFDISAEPPLSIYATATTDKSGVITWIEPTAMAFRVDGKPDWVVPHIAAGFKAKSDQLREQGVAPESGGGAVAIRVPPISPRQLLRVDEALREALATDHRHVSFIALYLEQAISETVPLTGTQDAVERKQGIQLSPYFIQNPNAPVGSGFSDSRNERFGPNPLEGSLVDSSTGRITALTPGDTSGMTELPKVWPPELWDDPRELNPAADSLAFVVRDTAKLYNNPGDLLLAEIQFGSNRLRVVRDEYLNMRALRFGDDGLRDHIALDLRPFRGRARLFVILEWNQEWWKLGVGTERKDEQVFGRTKR